MVTWLCNSSVVKIFGINEISVSLRGKKYPNCMSYCMSFSSLNFTKCVSHRGICIGNESLFSRHGLRPSIFSGPVGIDGERVIQGQWGTNISAFVLIGHQCSQKLQNVCYRIPEITLKNNTLYLKKVFQD